MHHTLKKYIRQIVRDAANNPREKKEWWNVFCWFVISAGIVMVLAIFFIASLMLIEDGKI